MCCSAFNRTCSRGIAAQGVRGHREWHCSAGCIVKPVSRDGWQGRHCRLKLPPVPRTCGSRLVCSNCSAVWQRSCRGVDGSTCGCRLVLLYRDNRVCPIPECVRCCCNRLQPLRCLCERQRQHSKVGKIRNAHTVRRRIVLACLSESGLVRSRPCGSGGSAMTCVRARVCRSVAFIFFANLKFF